MKVTGCGDGCVGWGGEVFRGVAGWVSDFCTNSIVQMLILTISMSILCLTQLVNCVFQVQLCSTLQQRSLMYDAQRAHNCASDFTIVLKD